MSKENASAIPVAKETSIANQEQTNSKKSEKEETSSKNMPETVSSTTSVKVEKSPSKKTNSTILEEKKGYHGRQGKTLMSALDCDLDTIHQISRVLTEAQYSLLTKRYGENLDTYLPNTITHGESVRLYQKVIPKLKKEMQRVSHSEEQTTVMEKVEPETRKEDLLPLNFQSSSPVMKEDNYPDDSSPLEQLEFFMEQLSKETESTISKQEKVHHGRQGKDLTSVLGCNLDTIHQISGVLTKAQYDLLTKRYGENLDTYLSNTITHSESVRLYQKVIPKLKTELQRVSHLEEQTIATKKVAQSSLEPHTNYFKGLPVDIKPSSKFTKEDYQQLRNYLCQAGYEDTLKDLPLEECVVASLSLSMVGNKTISLTELADLLQMDIEEVRTVLKKGLHQIKQTLDTEVDKEETEHVKKLGGMLGDGKKE